MLAQQETVVGCDNQRSVVPETLLVEVIQGLAEQKVAQTQKGEIICTQLVDFILRFGDALVARPIENRSVVVHLEGLTEPFRREERLMGVESFDLKKPVVRLAIGIEKVETGFKALHGWEICFFLDEFAIDHVMVRILLGVYVVLTVVILLLNAFDR